MRIDAVIFDLDGLMIDSERLTRDVFLEVCEKMGLGDATECYNLLIGGGKDTFDQVMKDYPQFAPAWPYAREERDKRMRELLQIKNSLNKPGLIELLTYLTQKHITKAVASSSRIEYVMNNINNFEPHFEFDAVTAGDQVKHTKPDPEVFLKTAEKLGVQPQYCLVIEDSKLGTIAAKRADMPCITIIDLVKMDDEFQSAVQVQLNSLDEVIGFLENNREE